MSAVQKTNNEFQFHGKYSKHQVVFSEIYENELINLENKSGQLQGIIHSDRNHIRALERGMDICMGHIDI